mmetsp:Transcript_6024/g.13144  ORF Transcript_6024/g.13144 Transcript_6024/m.13144 type:complete len:123 (-) Transcript_6024:824-1192(-)|eukprot:CAMPEP_0202907786 /NCGR_PEP_ID=MMETSP1392-20130828/43821_1 /ASSEMBLY_ACC=CAM_ASM_000868 /TAXON_ID=225041 /ORGANISM="Chlamydomonas chlamydogama, Strain SAG 11-48b" /LENGTH=122 /DNA_ID=CAMNT_0049596843 /DNA_START=60 /DNA_END=428 /DNA_ORIENTATION=+
MGSLIDEYQQFKMQLENELPKIERVVADLELQYLQAEYSQCGTILKGFEGFLSSKDNLRKRSRTYKPDERLFSLSSKTSPPSREVEQAGLESMDILPPVGFGKKGYATKGYAQKGYAQKGKR